MFKTSGRTSFLIIFFRLLEFYVFVALSVDVFALFYRHFYCDSFTRDENCIPNLPCTQRPFGNYWAFAVFSGPDFIANLSDVLKIIDTSAIDCHDIRKLLFVTSLKQLKQLFCHFNSLLFCSSVNRCGTHLAKILWTFICFFKIS